MPLRNPAMPLREVFSISPLILLPVVRGDRSSHHSSAASPHLSHDSPTEEKSAISAQCSIAPEKSPAMRSASPSVKWVNFSAHTPRLSPRTMKKGLLIQSRSSPHSFERL